MKRFKNIHEAFQKATETFHAETAVEIETFHMIYLETFQFIRFILIRL